MTQTGATPGTDITLATNALTLPAGTYLVSFGATGTSTATADLSVQLYANGAGIATETISDNATSTDVGSASKTIVYTAATDATTLSLYNVSTETLNLTDAYITALRIA